MTNISEGATGRESIYPLWENLDTLTCTGVILKFSICCCTVFAKF